MPFDCYQKMRHHFYNLQRDRCHERKSGPAYVLGAYTGDHAMSESLVSGQIRTFESPAFTRYVLELTIFSLSLLDRSKKIDLPF